MNARGSDLAAPARPQVNLLPAEIVQARSLGVVKRWMLASAGVTAVAVVTVIAVAQVQTQIAESQLSRAEAETGALIVQQRPFAEVTAVQSQLDTLEAAQVAAFGQEILWSDYLGALVAVTPDGIGIASIDFRGATPSAPAPASTDLLVPAGVGTLSFTAAARDVPDTVAWTEALDSVGGFSHARLTTVTLGAADSPPGLPYAVTGTVQVDDHAYSHRFDTRPEGNS